jgi:hypothetical protein
VQYNGPITESCPEWKRQRYVVYCRNTLQALSCMLRNSDYKEQFNYRPYREYIGPEKRRWSNLMSGTWAWDKAVCDTHPIEHLAFLNQDLIVYHC